MASPKVLLYNVDLKTLKANLPHGLFSTMKVQRSLGSNFHGKYLHTQKTFLMKYQFKLDTKTVGTILQTLLISLK